MSHQLSDLLVCLKTYGLLGDHECYVEVPSRICIGTDVHVFSKFDVDGRIEAGGRLYFERRPTLRVWPSRSPAYHALLPHVSFDTSGPVEPVWLNDAGRAVIAWHGTEKRTLLVGLNVVEELVRHHQGDPAQSAVRPLTGEYGFDFERPGRLFAGQLLREYASQPWADHLGFFMAQALSQLAHTPLAEPLPGGGRGVVILTGDDDQADLDRYQEQLKVCAGMPITYFVMARTKHTAETLAGMPGWVQLGVHPDALEQPDRYAELCASQTRAVRQLSARQIRTVRNHGYLSAGYLGHLKVWEDNGLLLDVNYPGVDGSALTGSFLPMRVRRSDGTWANHYSLLTLFGDGMLYALKLSEREAARRIRSMARQIERDAPGVMVVNFHPQNIGQTERLHREIRRLAKRRGWLALGLETYLDWVQTLEQIELRRSGRQWVLNSACPVEGLVLRCPDRGRWRTQRLGPWSAHLEVGAS
jgi:hypothetical protein